MILQAENLECNYTVKHTVTSKQEPAGLAGRLDHRRPD